MNAAETEAKRWFRQARADLEVVRTLVGAGHYATACFHSQQTAEKGLKALLYSQGNRVVLGHSIRNLAQQGESYEANLASLQEEATLLDQFYIPTRYPNGLPAPAIPDESYTQSQAETAQQAAERFVQTVEAFLRRHTGVLDES
jgi:HEPN domain-containing protein